MDFHRAKQYIINRLHSDLDRRLIYHDLEHTLRVYRNAERLCKSENVSDYDTLLVLTAALYHDSGMLITYDDHEEASVKICEEKLPAFGYTLKEIETVTSLIRKTKIKEKSVCNCVMEHIICDSDLDYLGRDDFFVRSTKLLLEWKLLHIHNYSLSEWLNIQIDFLEEHQYYTETAKQLRDETKQKNTEEIRELYKIRPNQNA